MAQTVERFGGIDLVVNNASAINLAPMRDLEVKRFDLMQQINARGTFVVTRACLPHLRESDHAHVLTLSPPLSADPRWLNGHSAYTLSKMGMTMITLGVAADEAEAGIGANCLWPRTIIATAAVQNLLGGDEAMARSRVPDIVADAAYEILSRDPRSCTGNVFIDDEVLAEAGVTTSTATRARRTPSWRSTSSWTAGPKAQPPASRGSVDHEADDHARHPAVLQEERRDALAGKALAALADAGALEGLAAHAGHAVLDRCLVERTPTPLAVRSPRPVVSTAVTVC